MKRATIYFSERSMAILARLQAETGKSRSEIANDAVQYYGERDLYLEAMLRRIIREEISLSPKYHGNEV